MTDRDIPLTSEALRVNIAGTAEQVTIPERYLPLLEAVRGFHGVREPLRDVLTEHFHRLRNVDAVVDGLETVLLRNWSYFERSDDRARLFELFAELLEELLTLPLGERQTSQLLRLSLTWTATAIEGPHGPEYATALDGLGRVLYARFEAQPVPFLERERLVRRLLRGARQHHVGGGALLNLSAAVQGFARERLHDRLDVTRWAGGDAPLNDPEAVRRAFRSVTRAWTAPTDAPAGDGATPPDDATTAKDAPTFDDLLDQAIEAIYRIDNLEDRFIVCLYFLKDDTLGPRQHDVMVDLLAVVKLLLHPDRAVDFNRLLDLLTHFFHERETLFPEMRFQIYQMVGEAIGEVGAVRAADHLIEDLLAWRFEYPEARGATDEWQTLVNPYHLPAVRCWLRIIGSNPLLFERLAAALDVQLRLGGVFIADTDLFQRDVTTFLNADLRPIYFAAKNLLRTLPVYFNEVGAEGELRSVSTEIDEICGRQDTLMHFLRKQVHAESSNRLVAFSRAVLEYWATLDPTGLTPFLSANTIAAVRSETEWARGPHAVLNAAAGSIDGGADQGRNGRGTGRDIGAAIDALVALDPAALGARLAAVTGSDSAVVDDLSRRRVYLLVRQDQLLEEKYSPSARGLAARVNDHLRLSSETRQRFVATLADWQAATATRPDLAPGPDPTVAPDTTVAPDIAVRQTALLDAACDVLEELKAIILSAERSEGVENIYHKRHIAAGIPSMYGDYTEPKFDALGLSFRVEVLVSRLLEDVAETLAVHYLSRISQRKLEAAMPRFERVLAIEGLPSLQLADHIALLEGASGRADFTFAQFRNIVQFLAQSVSDLTRLSILSHDQVLRTILEHDERECDRRGLGPDAVAEAVLREVLVSALGLQTVDRYVAGAVQVMGALADQLDGAELTRMMHYDPKRLISWIDRPQPDVDDQITLGAKARGLKHLAEYGFNVPEGFILTTELFAAMPAMRYRPLYDNTITRIRAAVAELEERTGRRLGDPERPLTLSIRSGAPVSMPGLMVTFPNVGLNDRLVHSMAADPVMAWTVWDSYRRFVQSWAMSAGVDRDVFDEIMTEAKDRCGVTQKLDFTASQMRDLALRYKSGSRDRGVVFIDDPFRQVITCIRWVLASWESTQARFYREYTGVAPEWGTAVIVQRMVLGNLGRLSGAGVTFTRDPGQPHSRKVRLFGDFAVGSQGEDLVGGLVYPLPISEAQRLGNPTLRGLGHSLERDFPEIYGALLSAAENLVTEREYDPQEIEFTFESPAAGDLYLLQKRAMVSEPHEELPIFDMRDCLVCEMPTALGVGVSGGAYAGRVALDAAQIDRLRATDPAEPVILLRPDTVPEDIAIIARVQGILTARGGSTSHAAVTAKRMGKTAVVDCRALEVLEREGIARLAGHELRPGDWLSIDGRTGHIYLGKVATIIPTDWRSQ